MRISHIDIKLTDGSTCVMNMDELPQVIQLSLKDTIFNWLLLRSSAQEAKHELSEARNKVEPEQAAEDKTTRRGIRNNERIAFSPNYQDDSPVIPLNGSFNIAAAINHESVWLSMDTGGLLYRDSIMVDCRQKILKVLAAHANRPMRSREIAETLGNNHAASSRHISDLVYMGVLSKNMRDKTYYISEWFINQIK